MGTQFAEITVSDRTVEFTDSLYFLKFAIVSRKDVKRLDVQWESPGIYVLVDGWADSWCAYVGKATKLSGRIPGDRGFEWSRALVVRRLEPFDSAEIGWLEGRIYGLLKARGVDLKNIQTPKDDTLNLAKQKVCENYVEVIQDALVLLGYDPEGHPQQVPAQTTELELEETEETKPATIGKPHRKLLDVVRVGAQIESTAAKYRATATVEATGTRYEGKLYTSPSAAAKAVMGTEAADGYSFWGVRSGSEVTRLKILRDQTHQADPAAGDTNPAHDRRQMEREQRRRAVAPYGKMSAAVVNRLLARRDKGATYDQLQKEFNLGRGSVYTLLEMYGRVRKR